MLYTFENKITGCYTECPPQSELPNRTYIRQTLTMEVQLPLVWNRCPRIIKQQWCCFKTQVGIYRDTLITKLTNFRGAVPDVSAETTSLLIRGCVQQLCTLAVGEISNTEYICFRHGAQQCTENLSIMFYGYHLDRTSPDIAEAYIVWCHA